MRDDITTEFSFILKPSKRGIGVFVTHNIKKGIFLRLFTDEGVRGDVIRKKSAIPKIFWGHCVDRGNGLTITPKDFSAMPVGCYINHSKNSNAVWKNDNAYYAIRDISEGEEILTDYNFLGEPEEEKENYYKN